ncbi:MAG: putative bifunctional diguanylate cyclase/phosphodiesterase [Prochlorotrichaceae cyanobacterium]
MPKILLIEDEAALRLNVVELLEAEGFQMLDAENARKGLEQALLFEPDLIICDISLPDLDGFSVLETLRRDPRTFNIPFIFLTARSSRTDQRRGMDLGADDYITKPFTTQELRSAIWSRLKRRKQYETELDKAKRLLEATLYSDSLTGLPNRLSLQDQFQALSHGAIALNHQLVIFSVGIDRFNRINESLGYRIGDKVLQHVAHSLRTCLTSQDTLARITGDQFVILLERSQFQDAESVAQSCLEILSVPITIEQHRIQLSSSLGMARYPVDGVDIETLIKRSSIAMNRVKRMSGNQVAAYNFEVDNETIDRLSLEPDLRYALQHQEFRVYYQPRVSLKTGQIVGAEALLRWFHPERGPIPPNIFIGLAEEIDLIGAIDEWVLRQACLDIYRWQQNDLPWIKVSVNLSATQFSRSHLAEDILHVLNEIHLSPDWLELEITETSLVRNPAAAADILRSIQNLGIRIALDDFGTGFSSLAYLQQFPLDILKIDQSFIRGMENNDRNQAIVRATLRMAKELRLEVVAEGVEKDNELEFLRQHHCDAIQGYLFSPPIPASEFETMLQNKQHLPLHPLVS